MKCKRKIFVLFVTILIITGCRNHGSNDKRVSGGNSVDQVINDQINRSDPNSSDVETDYSDSEESQSIDDLPETAEETSEEMGTQTADGVDYDLTAMSSDMVYAMVYQMMTDPYTYVGRTFRMDGLYYSVYQESTAQQYHYCIIQDALACCAQGMEFMCDDGIHISSDDYPKENAGIVVQGVFETYQEDRDNSLYCRLKEAVLEAGEN